MSRVNSNRYYLLWFAGILLIGFLLNMALVALMNVRFPGENLLIPIVAGIVTGLQFEKHEARKLDRDEKWEFIWRSYALTMVFNILSWVLFWGGLYLMEGGISIMALSRSWTHIIGGFVLSWGLQFLALLYIFGKFTQTAPHGNDVATNTV